MTFSDAQQFESYVPVYDVVPTTWEEGRAFIVEQLKLHAQAINVRVIGFYLDEELISGKAFIPGTNNNQEFRTVLRKVIDFGALPAVGIKSVAHGISFTSDFSLVQMYAAATDPILKVSLPIPYCDPFVLANGIALTIDATNVNIAAGSNRSDFTRCFVTIEYIQEL